MQNHVDKFKQELASIVIGRASPAVLDSVTVKYESKSVPLKKVAQVAVKDGQTLIVNVTDSMFTRAVDQGIRNADLGLNPTKIDDSVLQVQIPRMSKTTKDAYIKKISQMAEKSKRCIRDVRQNARTELKKGGEKVSVDDIVRSEKEVQKAVDQYIKQVEDLLAAKSKQINT